MALPDYVAKTWYDGSAGGTSIDAADLNDLELALADASAAAHSAAGKVTPAIIAPAPSGGDDTAALQPLLTQAQSTGGTLQLRAGTYKVTALTTSQSFTQPRIVGQGKNYTTIQGTGAAGSKVLRFKGGSGQFSGGYVADLTITGTGGQVGFEIADACGVRWTRLEFTGGLAEGLRFHNEATSGFSEFNQGDAEFAQSITLPVRYMKTSGAESFHGTGFTQGTVFNQSTSPAGPVIKIEQGCFPYNAPLTAAFFTRSTTPLISHQNTTSNRPASFYGHITVENFIANARLGDEAAVPIEYAGSYTVLGSTGFDQGSFRLNDLQYYNDAGITLYRKTLKVSVPATSTAVGDQGYWAADANWLYICVTANSWKRVALSSF